MGFLGQHEHTLDAKNRLTIPHRFRAALSDGVILAASLDPCVCIYTPAGWDSFTGQWVRSRDPLSDDARKIQRFFYGNSFDTQLDAAGRIMVPPALIEHGHLDKEVIVIGCGEWIEVWDRDRLRAHDEESGESIAESAQRLSAGAPVKR